MSAWPVSSWSSRESRRRSCSWPPTMRWTVVARDALRQVDGDGRPGRERSREAEVGVAEAGIGLPPVERHDDADRLARGR